ncbi:MAG: quinone oxidoreductase [Betaproteobacteria bacterium]|nr:quinone oxidoreductase [Betaproteobacteria bacterium]
MNRTKAVLIRQVGGPEVLELVDIDVREPRPDEVLVRQTAIGINLADVYQRADAGGRHALQLPAVPGMEGVGVIEEVGSAVKGYGVGDRVAVVAHPGAYAQWRTVPARVLLRLGMGIPDELAAAVTVKGMTAGYLVTLAHAVKPGQTIVVHAAAGGVGGLMCQWAKYLGATVIGVVSTEAKVAIARKAGCDHVLVSTRHDVASGVRNLFPSGVDVVYDGNGRDTFENSLHCLKNFGLLASFGQATGPVEPVDLALLAQLGSLAVSKPTFVTLLGDRNAFENIAAELFRLVGNKTLVANISLTARLEDVQQVHRLLESRSTTGSIVLIP